MFKKERTANRVSSNPDFMQLLFALRVLNNMTIPASAC